MNTPHGFYIILICLWSSVMSFESSKMTQFRRYKTPSFITEKFEKLQNLGVKKREAQVMIAMSTGYKSYLTKETKAHFKELSLLHILTPSGLHASSLLFWSKKLKTSWQIISILFSMFALFSWHGFSALKRVFIFRFLKLNLKILSIKSIFILTFIVDVMRGGYAESPLSLLFSFTFWGTILFTKVKSPLHLSLMLYLSLLISQYFLEQSTSIIIPVINLPLSILFCFIFPFVFIGTIIPLPFLSKLFSSLLYPYLEMMEFLAKQSFKLPHLAFNLGYILILYLFLGKRFKTLLLLLIFLPL